MRESQTTDEPVRPDAEAKARRRISDAPLGMSGTLDDSTTATAWSKKHTLRGLETFGKPERVAAKPAPRHRKPRSPYARLGLYMLGFLAFDAVAIWYLMPRWQAMLQPTAEPQTTKSMPYPPTFRPNARSGNPQNYGPMTVKRADLGQGFKCAGGLLYQTVENDGVKTIVVHRVKGQSSRCI